jgi:hypothetical protein
MKDGRGTMSKPYGRWAATLLTFVMVAAALPSYSSAQSAASQCQRIKEQDFEPRAVTVVALKLRAKFPEYSILRGQWVFGDVIAILRPQTCLMILRSELVAGSQLWYLVRYRRDVKSAATAGEGWLWGGAQGVDEALYIQGDKTPMLKSGRDGASWGGLRLVTAAYAQADTPFEGAAPITSGSQPSYSGGFWLWLISPTGSLITLFVIMILGMVAKAIWDQTERGALIPSSVQLVRPVLISPIAFSTFSGAMYLQHEVVGLSLTAMLFAFQIGFMWQHVLEKKVEQGSSLERRTR